jgi:hypothetical protein
MGEIILKYMTDKKKSKLQNNYQSIKKQTSIKTEKSIQFE